MSRRTLPWSAALRDIHSDRIHFAPGERRRLLREQGFADLAFRRASQGVNSRSLLSGNSFDRRVIMLLAIESARARREVTGEPWRVCLSSALRGTWKAAKLVKASMGARQKTLTAEANPAAAAAAPATQHAGAGEGTLATHFARSISGALPLPPAAQRAEPPLVIYPRRSLPRRSTFPPTAR
jgi:hypothetical protein